MAVVVNLLGMAIKVGGLWCCRLRRLTVQAAAARALAPRVPEGSQVGRRPLPGNLDELLESRLCWRLIRLPAAPLEQRKRAAAAPSATPAGRRPMSAPTLLIFDLSVRDIEQSDQAELEPELLWLREFHMEVRSRLNCVLTRAC